MKMTEQDNIPRKEEPGVMCVQSMVSGRPNSWRTLAGSLTFDTFLCFL